jgi:hypothetical protein
VIISSTIVPTNPSNLKTPKRSDSCPASRSDHAAHVGLVEDAGATWRPPDTYFPGKADRLLGVRPGGKAGEQNPAIAKGGVRFEDPSIGAGASMIFRMSEGNRSWPVPPQGIHHEHRPSMGGRRATRSANPSMSMAYFSTLGT